MFELIMGTGWLVLGLFYLFKGRSANSDVIGFVCLGVSGVFTTAASILHAIESLPL